MLTGLPVMSNTKSYIDNENDIKNTLSPGKHKAARTMSFKIKTEGAETRGDSSEVI